MTNLNIRTSIIVVGTIFLLGVVLSTFLFSVSQTLPGLEFPARFKLLFELTVYLVSLFLFANYKFKPALWLKGFFIILFFRVLFSIANGITFYAFFAKPPQTFGTMYWEALFKCNLSYIVQVLLSPCLAYPILVAVITDKVELDSETAKAPSAHVATVPPPPSITPPPDWAEEPAPPVEPEEGKASDEISKELLKELGLSELAESEGKKPAEEKKPIEEKKPSSGIDEDLKGILDQLEGESFFKEQGKEAGKVKSAEPPAKPSIDDLLEKPVFPDEIKPPEMPPEEKEPDKKLFTELAPPIIEEPPPPEPAPPVVEQPPKPPPPEEVLPISEEEPALDIELPAFDIPGVDKIAKADESEEPELEMPKLDMIPKEPSAEEKRIPPPVERISAPKEEPPVLPKEEVPPPVEEGLPEGVPDKMPAESDSAKANLDDLLATLSASDLPEMSFEEKPIIPLDDLPPLPNFPWEEGEPDKTVEDTGKGETPKNMPVEEVSPGPPAQKLASKPSDLISISVRRIIDYSKNTESAAVLDKLLRRGSDCKLQVPLLMILEQLKTGNITLTADYIYNQVPIELVNFISAEQGRNLQELELTVPLADVIKQISPELLAENMPGEQEESHWAKEGADVSPKVEFSEGDPKNGPKKGIED
ncbi:hypothetical protein J7L01_06630 [bacterium]|nr:hypothetical protein [bacterium]